TSVTGASQITGQGGTAATGALNIGVLVVSGGQVTSREAAAISLNGTGGSGTDKNLGVDVEGASSLVTSVTGAIQITGQGSTTARAAVRRGGRVVSGGQVASTGAETITLTGAGVAGERQDATGGVCAACHR